MQALKTTSPKLEEALVYAAQLHRQQRRKGGDIPYISHLLGVAAIVGEFGGDEEQMIAALLHDGPEDQGGEPVLAEIRRRFGERVAHIVDACTDTYETPKPPWRKRKEQYLEHLRQADADSRLVSAADKLYNAMTVLRELPHCGATLWKRFGGGREGTLWYYRSLAEEFLARGPVPLGEPLLRIVEQMEQHC